MGRVNKLSVRIPVLADILRRGYLYIRSRGVTKDPSHVGIRGMSEFDRRRIPRGYLQCLQKNYLYSSPAVLVGPISSNYLLNMSNNYC